MSTSALTYLHIRAAFGEVDLNGVAVSCHSIPMFHAMGMFQIGAAACSTLWSLFYVLNLLYLGGRRLLRDHFSARQPSGFPHSRDGF